jgi:hypothetical protein
MSPTPDSALADPQQVIAELRRELAEMQGRLGEALAERDEGETQKVAMTQVLQVINSSPGDLAPVFDAMLEKATRLCEASFGILWSFTDDLAVAGALHQVPEAFAELCRAPFHHLEYCGEKAASRSPIWPSIRLIWPGTS